MLLTGICAMQNSKIGLRGERERTGNRIGSSPVRKLQNMCTSIHPQLCIMRKKKQLCVLSADSASADKSDEFPGAVSSYLRPTLALVFPPRLESS